MSLILSHNVDEATYLARIPIQPLLLPLTPFETARLGLPVNSVQQWARILDFFIYSDRFGKIVIPATKLPIGPGSSVTDLASIPPFAQGFTLRNDSPQILPGSVVHDHGFENAGEFRPDLILPFEDVNKLLAEIMWYCNASDREIDYVYAGVNSCVGRKMWNDNCERLGHPERKVALV